MRRFLLSLLFCPLAALALPRLELDVRLDPATREFNAVARLAGDKPLNGFVLAPEFEVTSASVDGRPARLPGLQGRYRVPGGGRTIEIAYRARLAPLAALDHRQVLADRAAVASPEGSFLPAASRWYPDPGGLFAHRVRLRLPAGQKGLVEGELVSEDDTAEGWRAEFDFPHPADGIHLMAGPYVVGERALKLPSGRGIRIRTWFHPELASLSPGYLEDASRYIERYSRQIGDYPFGMFSVVSSPTPTGFGMPTLTYLGREVLKLPFIRATSLGHEVLHNWWGNGVLPDWQTGNWSEGLTTFLADYAYTEDESEEAARDMRMGWLRDYAAVPASEDFALKDFTSRRHGIASIIGYNKAAMVFLMLRDRIGKDAFDRGLRFFWERHRFRTAGWADLEAAFSEAAGQRLSAFFRTWVELPGAPPFAGDDPDFRIWRRIDPAVFPPILRETFVAPRAGLVVPDDDAKVRAAALALAQRVLDARPATIADGPADGRPRLVIGTPAAVEGWLAKHGLPPRPATLPSRGSAQVWAGRDAAGRSFAVVVGRDAASLTALERGLPHYGKQSWLVFEGPRTVEKGVWPPRADGAGRRPASR